jgi:hypothetical protein
VLNLLKESLNGRKESRSLSQNGASGLSIQEGEKRDFREPVPKLLVAAQTLWLMGGFLQRSWALTHEAHSMDT